PFFDGRLALLTAISERYPKVPVIVGIEPTTVELSAKALETSSADFRDATELYRSTGYLHAKAILFDTGGTNDVLILGSANPSAPAWMGGGGRGNSEAIIFQQGTAARLAAKDLGLAAIVGMPRLSKLNRELITQNQRKTEQQSVARVTVATVVDEGFAVPAPQ